MKPIISLDELDIVATVTRQIATSADVLAVVAEINRWHADEGEPYTVTADEVGAVLRGRGYVVNDGALRVLMPQVR